MSERRAAMLRVDLDVLRSLLGLPESVRITTVVYDADRDRLCMRVEGGSLPVANPGEVIQELRGEVSTRQFVSWRIE